MGQNKCACGCGANVRLSGDHRRACRLRELAAGRWCPRNVRSADQLRRVRALNSINNPITNKVNNPINNPKNSPKNNLKNNSKNNKKNNPKNNPKNNKKNNPKNNPKNNKLKLVQDDPTILETKKMSPGTSAPLSVPTDNDWCTGQP